MRRIAFVIAFVAGMSAPAFAQKAEIDAATEEALTAPMPDPSTAADGVFCEGEAEPLGDGVARWSGFRSARSEAGR